MDSDNICVGSIQIDDFVESLAIPLYEWSKNDYIEQWRSSVRMIVDRADTAALLVEYYGSDANYAMCWSLYRDSVGDTVYVQNQLIMYENLDEPFRLDKIVEYASIGDFSDNHEHPVSEWETTIGDLEYWLKELEQF